MISIQVDDLVSSGDLKETYRYLIVYQLEEVFGRETNRIISIKLEVAQLISSSLGVVVVVVEEEEEEDDDEEEVTVRPLEESSEAKRSEEEGGSIEVCSVSIKLTSFFFSFNFSISNSTFS